MTFGLIDTHCHLDLEPLRSILPDLLREADEAGVTRLVVPGVHPDGWHGISQLLHRYPQISAAYGVHPMFSDRVTDAVLSRLKDSAPCGVAVGEIGLDPAYPVALELQERAFRAQLRIAIEAGLPVLIHCRRHFQRVLTVLREEGADGVGGIMHAFSGSMEMAREFIRLGFAISLSGTVTRNNAVKPLRLARELPLESLVLESDAPDLPPAGHRGEFNRPAWLRETALRVAELRGEAPEYIAEVTAATAVRILRLRPLVVQ